METRANYVLIGAFTLAVIAGVFGFIYWFQNIGGTGERLLYRIVFDGSVSGLRTGATVLFNGIRVGEVTGLRLDPAKPKQVVATLSVDQSVTVREDTQISLEFQGLTGIASVALAGGNPEAKVITGAKADETPALLTAPPGATQDVTATARDVMRKLDEFITQNQKTFTEALVNIEKFTATLSNNSGKIDATLSNIEKFTAALGANSDNIDKTLAKMLDKPVRLNTGSLRLGGHKPAIVAASERATRLNAWVDDYMVRTNCTDRDKAWEASKADKEMAPLHAAMRQADADRAKAE